MSGYCSFTAKDRPSWARARCTWPSEAEAAAEAEGDTIADLMGAGDSPEMEAVVEEQVFEELTEDAGTGEAGAEPEPEVEEATAKS